MILGTSTYSQGEIRSFQPALPNGAQIKPLASTPIDQPRCTGFLNRRQNTEKSSISGLNSGSLESSPGSSGSSTASLSSSPAKSFHSVSPLTLSQINFSDSTPQVINLTKFLISGQSNEENQGSGSGSELSELSAESSELSLEAKDTKSLKSPVSPMQSLTTSKERLSEEVKDVDQLKASLAWQKSKTSPSLLKRSKSPLQPAAYRTQKEQFYKLSEPSPEERAEIDKLIANQPNLRQNYTLLSAQKFDNPVLTDQFLKRMEYLQLKASNPAFTGSWDKEPEQETRQKVHRAVEQIRCPTKYKNVFTLTAFHATKENILDPILKSGLDFLGKTDKGYFGQGIYFTTFLKYALKVYSPKDRLVLLCEICFRNVFPVASCDDLMGGAIKACFDGHYAQVIPKTDNPNEVMFISTNPFKAPMYDEFVAKDPAQIRIKYVLRFASTGVDIKKVDPLTTQKALRELILAYLQQNPLDEQFVLLNQKLVELNASLDKQLDPTEFDLFIILQRSLGEKDLKIKTILGERVKKLFITEESLEESSTHKLLPKEVQKTKPTEEKDEAYLKQADVYFYAGENKKALAEYQKVLKNSPPSLAAHLGCGHVYLQLEDFEQAFFHFDAARKIDPENDKAISGYVSYLVKSAMNLGKAGEYEKALKNLGEALKLGSKNALVLGAYASTCFAKKDFDQAFVYCERALAVNPKCDIALRVRGAIYAEKGRNVEALENLSASINLNPHHFPYIKRAYLYLSMGRLDEAQNDCNKILEKDSEHSGALALRAKIFLLEDQLKSAEKDLKKCFEQDREDPFVLSLFGTLYFKKEKFKQALEYFNLCTPLYQKLVDQKTIEEKDKVSFYQVLINLARTHALMSNFDLARINYQRAIDLDPEKTEAYKQRAKFYRERGDEIKAQADDSKALSLTSTNSSLLLKVKKDNFPA